MHTAGQKPKKNNKFISTVADVLFPPRCPICDGLLEPEEKSARIHRDCVGKLYPVRGSVCMHCGRPLECANAEYCHDCVGKVSVSELTQGKALFLYQGSIKETMYRFKYSNRREYARFFAAYAKRQYGEWIKSKGIDVIIPVPMYEKKRRLRGYNQAESLARALSLDFEIPVDTGLVQRVKDTMPQKALSDLERKKNLKNAFQSKESVVQYKEILLVDDIYTTGSTAMAVAEAIRKTNACRVYVLSVCIGKGM